MTFEDLDNYFNIINLTYFNTFLTEWLNSYLKDDKETLNENLDFIRNYFHKIGYKEHRDRYASPLSIFFKQEYIMLRKKDGASYYRVTGNADFEQSDIIYWPSIKIFCTSEKYNEDLFNRYTYFHEIGHSLKITGFYNITDKNVCIGILKDSACNDLAWNFNIHNDIKARYPGFLEKIQCAHLTDINEIILSNNTKNPAASYDIIADIFSFSVIIKEMEDNNKSIKDIFDTVCTICASLGSGSDDNHYSSKLRFILIVYFIDNLRNYFEQNIVSKLSIDPYIYVPTKNVVDKCVDLLEKLKKLLTVNTEEIEKIDKIIGDLNSYKDIILNYFIENPFSDLEVKINKYINIYESYNDTQLISNKNKIILLMEDLCEFMIDDNESLYQKKYIKYKNKYLAIKKKLAL